MWTALVVAVMFGVSGPAMAYANGMGKDGPVIVGVIGEKLHVEEARATLKGWRAGARARILVKRPGKRMKPVTAWRYTRSREAAGHKFEYAEWKIDRNFPDHSSMCAQFEGYSQRACATIHN